MLIYNAKEKTLKDERKLNNKEDKLIKILGSNDVIQISKLKKEMNIKKDDEFSLDILIGGLRCKGLNIKNLGKSYELLDEIYFE